MSSTASTIDGKPTGEVIDDAIDEKVSEYDKSIEQSADSTSCGWYALLNLLYKGKIKSQPF